MQLFHNKRLLRRVVLPGFNLIDDGGLAASCGAAGLTSMELGHSPLGADPCCADSIKAELGWEDFPCPSLGNLRCHI